MPVAPATIHPGSPGEMILYMWKSINGLSMELITVSVHTLRWGAGFPMPGALTTWWEMSGSGARINIIVIIEMHRLTVAPGHPVVQVIEY